MDLTIRPLRVGTVPAMPQPAFTHMSGWGQERPVAMLMFLIEGAGTPILVDTGPSTPERASRYHGCDLVTEPGDDVAAALAAAGVDVADVGIVVNTHLHWDHCSNNALFTNATFYVQASELAYAASPLPVHRAAYEKLPGLQPPWLAVWDRIESVAGDRQIVPGVSVVSLPGHSPGSQGVLVETGSARYLVAGDCVSTYGNWQGKGDISHLPTGSFTSLCDFYASFSKIEDLECEVIPSHDLAVLDRAVFD